MKWTRAWIAIAIGAGAVLRVTGSALGQQASDAETLVMSARQALGGEAALAGVTSLTINGSLTQRLSQITTSASYESSWQAPDKFLRISRRTTGGPMSFTITDYDGFNGDAAIHDVVAPDAPVPVTIPGPQPRTPEEAAAARARSLDAMRSKFFEAVIPLFVIPPGAWRLEVSFAGKAVLDKAQIDVVDIKRADGKIYRLLLDEQTHLPLRLLWKAKPIVMMSTTSRSTSQVTVRPTPGGMEVLSPLPDPVMPNLPAGDPTAGLPYVQWEMAIRDYKVSDGLNWPRRLTTSYGGQEWEDLRISRYRLNPKIDMKIFERKK
jgi:hypothetical protein